MRGKLRTVEFNYWRRVTRLNRFICLRSRRRPAHFIVSSTLVRLWLALTGRVVRLNDSMSQRGTAMAVAELNELSVISCALLSR